MPCGQGQSGSPAARMGLFAEVIRGDIPDFFSNIAASSLVFYILNHANDSDRCVGITGGLTDEPSALDAVGIGLAVFYFSRTGFSERDTPSIRADAPVPEGFSITWIRSFFTVSAASAEKTLSFQIFPV